MKLLSDIFDFLFPRSCHLCQRRLHDGAEYLCPSCLAELPRTHYHRLPDNAMERRFMGQFPFRAATGHFFYSRGSGIASLVHDMKYHHFRRLAVFMGRTVAEELLTTGFLSDIDVIMPVPMHFLKKAKRGYNQAECIASGISRVTGIPVSTDLRAVRGHRSQTLLTLEERLRNTEGIFRLDNASAYSGKAVLLVDDVCTTGATLASAAREVTSAAGITDLTILTLGVTF